MLKHTLASIVHVTDVEPDAICFMSVTAGSASLNVSIPISSSPRPYDQQTDQNRFAAHMPAQLLHRVMASSIAAEAFPAFHKLMPCVKLCKSSAPDCDRRSIQEAAS